jgi:hypothetical protein
MPYGYATAGTALTALLERLGDPNGTFWTNSATFAQSEVAGYLVEALRTWNAFSWFWRDRETFNLSSGTPFYDLTSPGLPSLSPAGGVRPYTVTDQQLIGMIEYQLLEPYSVASWTGSEMFTLDGVTQALQRRLNQFLVETGIILTHGTQAVAGGGNGQIVLPDTVVDVVRACWIDQATGTASPVWKSDTWAARSYAPAWNLNPATPKNFSIISTPVLTFQLIPPPANAGTLDYLAVQSGPVLNPSVAPTVLGIPDDFAWVVKMGALADLLGHDGPARDPNRSAYCEKRWEDGCELARQYATAIQAQLQGAVATFTPVFGLDTQVPGWQSTPAASQNPAKLALAGSNLIAAYPVPNGAGPWTVALDLVRNAQVPAASTDYIQVGREEYNIILGYALHLAAFKMQGTEFENTVSFYQQLVRFAGQYNERLEASTFYLGPIGSQSQRHVARYPRRTSDEELVGTYRG